MRMNPDSAPETHEAYRLRLKGLTDAELFREAQNKIWLSAYASNNTRSCFHWEADATYMETKRRSKPDVYSHAYRLVFMETQGRDPHPNKGPIPSYEESH